VGKKLEEMAVESILTILYQNTQLKLLEEMVGASRFERPVRPASSPTRKRDNKLLVIPRNVTTFSAACLHAVVLTFVCWRTNTLCGELGHLISADVSARRRADSRSLFVATPPAISPTRWRDKEL
jgi:hypothetical protein